jgi:hypothetical protein
VFVRQSSARATIHERDDTFFEWFTAPQNVTGTDKGTHKSTLGCWYPFLYELPVPVFIFGKLWKVGAKGIALCLSKTLYFGQH